MRRGPEEGDRPSGWNVGGVARPHLTPGRDRDDGTVMQGGKGHKRETTEAYSREQLGVTSSWGGRHFGWLLCCISGIQVNTLFLSAPEGPLYAVSGRGSRGELPAHEWGAVQRRVGDNPSRRDGTRDEFRQAGRGPWTVAESGWRCVCGTSHAAGVSSLVLGGVCVCFCVCKGQPPPAGSGMLVCLSASWSWIGGFEVWQSVVDGETVVDRERWRVVVDGKRGAENIKS